MELWNTKTHWFKHLLLS